MLEWSNIQPIIESSISLFAICDPIGVLPMFCGLTADVESREQRFMFRMAGVISLVAVMLMSVFGDFVLSYVFHIIYFYNFLLTHFFILHHRYLPLALEISHAALTGSRFGMLVRFSRKVPNGSEYLWNFTPALANRSQNS